MHLVIFMVWRKICRDDFSHKYIFLKSAGLLKLIHVPEWWMVGQIGEQCNYVESKLKINVMAYLTSKCWKRCCILYQQPSYQTERKDYLFIYMSVISICPYYYSSSAALLRLSLNILINCVCTYHKFQQPIWPMLTFIPCFAQLLRNRTAVSLNVISGELLCPLYFWGCYLNVMTIIKFKDQFYIFSTIARVQLSSTNHKN